MVNSVNSDSVSECLVSTHSATVSATRLPTLPTVYLSLSLLWIFV